MKVILIFRANIDDGLLIFGGRREARIESTVYPSA
jgi:hypothetical protein